MKRRVISVLLSMAMVFQPIYPVLADNTGENEIDFWEEDVPDIPEDIIAEQVVEEREETPFIPVEPIEPMEENEGFFIEEVPVGQEEDAGYDSDENPEERDLVIESIEAFSLDEEEMIMPYAEEVIASGFSYPGCSWTLDEVGTLTISGYGEAGTLYDDSINMNNLWRTYKDEVRNIVFEEGVTAIGMSAFSDAVNLETITLASTIQEIRHRAFSGCSALTSLYYNGTNDQWNAISIDYGNAIIREAGPVQPQESGTWGNFTWTLNGSTLIINGTGAFPKVDLTYKDGAGRAGAPWLKYDDYIRVIDIDAGVTEITSQSIDTRFTQKLEKLYFRGSAPDGLSTLNNQPKNLTIYYPDADNSWDPDVFAQLIEASWSSYCSLSADRVLTKDHSFTNYQPDANASCMTAGTKTAVCDNGCGKKDTITDSASGSGHSYTYGNMILRTDGKSYPTDANMAYRMKTCSVCNTVETENLECVHGIDTTGMESDHPYSTETDTSWTMSMAGAEEITLVFDPRTKLETNYDDYLYIYDENGNLFRKYINEQLAGATISVPGSSVTIKMTTDYSADEWGFAVTEAYGTTHDWGNGMVLRPVSGIHDGEMSYTCSICGLSKIESIPAPYIVAGTEEVGIEWGITSDGTLEIQGNGELKTYSEKYYGAYEATDAPWGAYYNQIKKLVIGPNVTTIGNNAFYGLNKLENIDFGGVRGTIGFAAFKNCISLKKVDFPSSITCVGMYAFYNCSSLEEISVTNSMDKIDMDAFGMCKNLKKVHAESLEGWLGVEMRYPVCAPFYSSESGDLYINGVRMENLVIPSSCTAIYANQFYCFTGIQNISLPENLESIGKYAFYQCSDLNLSKSKFPSSLVSIGEYAFYKCSSLEAIAFPSCFALLGEGAFEYCYALKSVGFAKDTQVETIPKYVFGSCHQLAVCELPKSIKRIEASAFWSCNSLKHMDIPEQVYSIETGAFEYVNASFIFWGDCPTIQMASMYGGEKFYFICNDTWKTAEAQSSMECNGYNTWKGIHMSASPIADQPATCTTDGETSFTCDRCSELVKETIPASGHAYEVTASQQPTCQSSGFTTWTCEKCGDTYTDTLDPDLYNGHQYDTTGTVVAPTCSQMGYTSYPCLLCQEERRTDYVSTTDHNYQSEVHAPTCQYSGYTYYYCQDCGTGYTDQWIDPIAHTYEVSVVAPTCTSRGYTVHSCMYCSSFYTDQYLPALDHKYEEKVVDPTCTERGYTSFSCSVCGDSYTGKWRPAKGHTYHTVVTPSSCSEEGFVTYTCDTCSYSYEGDRTEKEGHIWNLGSVTKPATYLETGIRTYTCDACGVTYDETIPVKEQKDLSELSVVLSYSDAVYDGTEKCPTVIVKDGGRVIPASEYNVYYENNVSAGEAKVYISAVGENSSIRGTTFASFEIQKAQQTISVKQYQESVHVNESCQIYADANGMLSFCLEDMSLGQISDTGVFSGYREGPVKVIIKAAATDDYEEASTELIMAVTGHREGNTVIENYKEYDNGDITYENVVHCSICGNKELSRTPVKLHRHIYEESIVEATCTTSGYHLHTCMGCGQSYRDQIVPATNHMYSETVTEPTCREEGFTIYICNSCGDTYQGKWTNAAGHQYAEEVIEPSCKEKGYTTYTCTICSQSYTDHWKSATGHHYQTEIRPSTCTEDGLTLYICESCGYSFEGPNTDTAGHKWDNGVVTVEPTYQAGGLLIYTCSVCGESYSEEIENLKQTDLGDAVLILSYINTTYSGLEKKPSVTVRIGDNVVPASEYTIEYLNNTCAGEAEVRVYAKENTSITGMTSKIFQIKKKNQVLQAVLSEDIVHCGQQANISVYGQGGFSLSTESNDIIDLTMDGMITAKAPGTAYVTVQAEGDENYLSAQTTLSITVDDHQFMETQMTAPTWLNYGHSVLSCTICGIEKKEEIAPLGQTDLSICTVLPAFDSMVYTGSEKTPAIIVLKENQMVDPEEYEVEYSNNINAGIATIFVRAKDGDVSITGSTSANFTIIRRGQDVTAALSTDVLHMNDTAQLTVTGEGEITCYSSDDSVATIDEQGQIQAVSPGTIVLTAYASGNENTESASAELMLVVEDHSFDTGVVREGSTCQKEGYSEETCSICGAVRIVSIPKTAHKYENYSYNNDATCTEDGTMTAKCRYCDSIDQKVVLNTATGHQLKQVVVKDPTCTEKGIQESQCTNKNCKHVSERTEIPAKGHTFGEWQTVREADVFQAQQQKRTCTVSGCTGSETRSVGTPLKATGVLTAKNLKMQVGQKTNKFKVTGLAKGDYIKSWKSSKKSVVKVSGKKNGTCTITALKRGTSTITIKTAANLTLKVKITVQKPKITTTSIEGLKSTLKLKKGKKTTLKPILNPITSQDKITYISSNKKIITVTSKGVVKAIRKGNATITVKAGKKKFVINVTV